MTSGKIGRPFSFNPACQTYAVQSSRLLDVHIQTIHVRIINEIIIDKRFFDQSKS